MGLSKLHALDVEFFDLEGYIRVIWVLIKVNIDIDTNGVQKVLTMLSIISHTFAMVLL